MKYNLINVIFVSLVACIGPKELITRHEVVNGVNTEKVPEVSFDTFFQIWMQNRTHWPKVDRNCYELNQDRNFKYFGKCIAVGFAPDTIFFKCNRDSIDSKFSSYDVINPSQIRRDFFKLIVADDDKQYYPETCLVTKNINDLKMELVGNKIKINLHRKIACGKRVFLDKNYIGFYDLGKNKMEEH